MKTSQTVGTQTHFVWLRGIIAVVFVLNVVDAVLTLYWVFAGMAVEANPLMERLISLHPVLFVTTKLGLVALGSVLLWRLRHHSATVVAIFLLFLVYYYLLLYHLRAMNLRVIHRWF